MKLEPVLNTDRWGSSGQVSATVYMQANTWTHANLSSEPKHIFRFDAHILDRLQVSGMQRLCSLVAFNVGSLRNMDLQQEARRLRQTGYK